MIVPSRSVATIFMDTIVSHAVSSAVTARGAALNPSGRVTAGGDHHFRWNLDADLLPHGPRPAPAPSRRKHGPTRAFRDRWCHPRRRSCARAGYLTGCAPDLMQRRSEERSVGEGGRAGCEAGAAETS